MRDLFQTEQPPVLAFSAGCILPPAPRRGVRCFADLSPASRRRALARSSKQEAQAVVREAILAAREVKAAEEQAAKMTLCGCGKVFKARSARHTSCSKACRKFRKP